MEDFSKEEQKVLETGEVSSPAKKPTGATIRPKIPLTRTFSSGGASIRERANKLRRQAERHGAYTTDSDGKPDRHRIDLHGSNAQGAFFPTPDLYTLEGLEFWLKMRLLWEHKENQEKGSVALMPRHRQQYEKRTVVAEGVMIGIGTSANTRVIVSGKIVYFDHDVVEVRAVSMTRDGKNLLEGGKPDVVAIKICKISRIALYKPWGNK